MKTTKEIAVALLAATTLTEDTTADFREYRRTKRATGAPVDLEDAVVHVANHCQDAMEELRRYLEKARREADERIAALDHSGVRMGQFTWFVLDGRKSAEDRAAAAAERRKRAVAILAARPARDLRALAKAAGLKVGTDREEIAAALVDGGYMESLGTAS